MDAIHSRHAPSLWDRVRKIAAGGKKNPRLTDYIIATGAIFSGISAMLLVAAGLWWALDTTPPLRVVGDEYAEKKDVEAGGPLVIVRNYCVDRPIKGVVERRIVDGVVWSLPATETTGDVGCFLKRRFLVDLPEAIPPGEYRYLVTIRYQLNPISTVTASHKPVHFRIVPKK